MRYRFYREHKFVSTALNDLERQIAKTDFCNVDEVVLAQQNFAALTQMLKHHARYEDEKIHALLRVKNSHVQTHVERDHVEQQAHMDAIAEMFNDIAHEIEREKKLRKAMRSM